MLLIKSAFQFAGFFPFGLDCGDSLLSPDAAGNSSLGLVTLDQPLMIYGTPETEFYVRKTMQIGYTEVYMCYTACRSTY